MDLSPAPFTIYDAQGAKIVFNVWGGSLYMKCYMTRDDKQPKFSTTINQELQFIMGVELRTIKAAPPSTKKPIIISKFNKDLKKFENDYVLILSKDEHSIISIELQSKTLPSSVKCTLSIAKSITVGSEPIKPNESSAIKLDQFIAWLNMDVNIARALTKERYDPSKFKSNNSGNQKSQDSHQSDSEYF